MIKIDGRWSFVTGSTRGIGQEVAVGLAAQGSNIIVHGRKKEHAKKVLARLKDLNVEVREVYGDLGSESGVLEIIDDVKALGVHVDILYNNAAVSNTATPVFEFTQLEWLRTFQVNLFAVVQLCSAFAPGMRERKWGRIVNVTSGIADQPSLAPYSVSKASVDKLTQDLSVEFKDENVLINHIDPGWIQTDLGGADAWEPVESVLPGMLIPVLLDDNGSTGHLFKAQDYKGLKL